MAFSCSLAFQKFFSITITTFLTVGQNNFGNKVLTIYHFFQVSEPFRYKNKQIKHGEGVLSIEQARLPFNIALESLKPFNVLSSGYNYSSTGMRIHFKRNTFGLLVGGYYGPTIIFTLLSLVSYTINADMVSMDSFQSLKTMK